MMSLAGEVAHNISIFAMGKQNREILLNYENKGIDCVNSIIRLDSLK